MKKRYVIIFGIVLLSLIPILLFIDIEILKAYLLLIFLLALVIISLFFIIDIQAIAPNEVKERHTLIEMQYHNRKIFILKPRSKIVSKCIILYLVHTSRSTECEWS